MMLRKFVFATSVFSAFVINALADNPISSYHYLADPAATADDSTFYILTDSDDPAGQSGYTIKALYGFSSQDMANWTDYGIIFEAKREFDYVSNIWASGIAIKNGKFYITYPDGAGSVGLVVGDRINGPYTNPINGKQKLVGGNGLVGCDGVAWCFDPGIFFDDDETGWITFGGGNGDSRPIGDNFTMYKMVDNGGKISFDLNSKVQVKGTKCSLEASYIHKYKGQYYFSYSTSGSCAGAINIDYAMSDKVTGPYTYKGTILENPNINGKNINANNNNHHGLAEFQGHWYAVYHDRRLVQAAEHPASSGFVNPEPSNHRSVSIDEMFYNADGTIQKVKFTNEGPKQIRNFNPYKTYPALTSSKQRNVRSRTDWDRTQYNSGNPAKHVLTPYASKESWIRVSGVDFGAAATRFIVEAASIADGNKIELRKGSVSGTLAGTCSLKNTGNWQTYAVNECEVDGLSGIVDQLFMVFKGERDSTMGIMTWEFEGSGSTSPTPRTAYEGNAVSIPGTIEAELFDVSGTRDKAYSDNDSENRGDAEFRTDEGVDIVLVDENDASKGKAVGYSVAGEWLEYTVDAETSGDFYVLARVASDADNSGFSLSLDGTPVAEFAVTNTGNWQTYKEIASAKAVHVTAGAHVLRIDITGSNVNIDRVSIVENLTEGLIKGNVVFQSQLASPCKVYSVKGRLVGTFDASDVHDVETALRKLRLEKGLYLVVNKNFSRMMAVREN